MRALPKIEESVAISYPRAKGKESLSQESVDSAIVTAINVSERTHKKTWQSWQTLLELNGPNSE